MYNNLIISWYACNLAWNPSSSFVINIPDMTYFACIILFVCELRWRRYCAMAIFNDHFPRSTHSVGTTKSCWGHSCGVVEPNCNDLHLCCIRNTWLRPCSPGCIRCHVVHKDHFAYAPSQWEATLHCNVVSHWLGAYTKFCICTQPMRGDISLYGCRPSLAGHMHKILYQIHLVTWLCEIWCKI